MRTPALVAPEPDPPPNHPDRGVDERVALLNPLTVNLQGIWKPPRVLLAPHRVQAGVTKVLGVPQRCTRGQKYKEIVFAISHPCFPLGPGLPVHEIAGLAPFENVDLVRVKSVS